MNADSTSERASVDVEVRKRKSEDVSPDSSIPPIKRSEKDGGPESETESFSSKKNSESNSESNSEAQTNFIELLPIELQSKIFSYLSSCEDRQKARLVCRGWYNTMRTTQTEYISFDGEPYEDDELCIYACPEIPFERLKDCGFRRVNIRFLNHVIQEFPVPVLEKIGSGVLSLSFWDCFVGDQAIATVISHCDNLRHLQVGGYSFCSPEVLERMEIVRTKLESLKITMWYEEGCIPSRNLDDYEIWERTFNALLRIFPNVVHFRAGCYVSYGIMDDDTFGCEFSKELDVKYEPSSLVSVLALSMTFSVENRRKALNGLSTLTRLTFVSLNFLLPTYTEEDIAALLQVFTNAEKLIRVNVSLSAEFSGVMLKTVLFQVLDNCPNLRKAHYFYCPSYCYEPSKDWAGSLTPEELSRLHLKTLNLKSIKINDVKIRDSSSYMLSV